MKTLSREGYIRLVEKPYLNFWLPAMSSAKTPISAHGEYWNNSLFFFHVESYFLDLKLEDNRCSFFCLFVCLFLILFGWLLLCDIQQIAITIFTMLVDTEMSKTEALPIKYWNRWRKPFIHSHINSLIIAFIHSFIYSLNKYTYTECLLYARLWGSSSNQSRQVLWPHCSIKKHIVCQMMICTVENVKPK